MASAQSPSAFDIEFPVDDEKKYQAYILSISILFCFILFMLLYFLFIKKQASDLSHPPPLPTPTPLTRSPSFSFAISFREIGFKDHLIGKLPIIVFDEELKARDSLCCVCLGEFEIKEELTQVPSCKHIFHDDCIRNWLITSATCPLCRSSVVVEDNIELVCSPPPGTSPVVLLPAATSSQLAQANLSD